MNSASTISTVLIKGLYNKQKFVWHMFILQERDSHKIGQYDHGIETVTNWPTTTDRSSTDLSGYIIQTFFTKCLKILLWTKLRIGEERICFCILA